MFEKFNDLNMNTETREKRGNKAKDWDENRARQGK